MSTIYRHRHPLFLGIFLKNMFFLATAWFAASIAIRMVVLTLSILFSPPVFALLLLIFATSWWSFDTTLRNDHNPPFPTTAAFGGRSACHQHHQHQHQHQCHCSSRRIIERRREFCRRFQQQCQSQCQPKRSCQKSDNETKPSGTTENSSSKSENKTSSNNNSKEEGLKNNNNNNNNNNCQPKRVFYQTTPFHIEQDNEQVTISIDVPGYSVSDLNITIDQDGTLDIAGKRRNKIGDAFAFQRQCVLSPTTTMDTSTTSSVTANVVDGLLTIAIAKKETPKPRLITITTEAAQETDRDEAAEGPSEELEKEEMIVLQKAPVEDNLSTKKPITVETVNDDDDDDQIEESDPVEGDHHDSWEDVIKA